MMGSEGSAPPQPFVTKINKPAAKVEGKRDNINVPWYAVRTSRQITTRPVCDCRCTPLQGRQLPHEAW